MKNKKILTAFLIVIVLCVSACLLLGCTKNNENLLTTDNGTFRSANLTALQSDFDLATDSSKNISDVFTVNYDSETNTSKITIDTSSAGWATISQNVKLESGSYYRISYTITVTSIAAKTSGENFDGVFVSFDEDEDFNYNPGGDASDVSAQTLMQTQTSSESDYQVGFKAKSGGNATLTLHIGTEKYPVSANVTLSKLSLEKVSKSVYATVGNDAGSFETDYYGQISDFNVFYIVVGAFLIAVLSFVGYFLFQRHLYRSKPENNGYKENKFLSGISDSKYLGIILVAVIACFVRLLADVLSTVIASSYLHSIMGYNLEGLTTQAMFMSKYGFSDLGAYLSTFATENSLTYTAPVSSALQLYFLAFCGLFGRIFESSGFVSVYYATMFFIRFFFALADIGTAILIYIMVKKNCGSVGAVIVAVLYSLLPVVFATSSVWGYAESVTVFLIVLSMYFMLKKNNQEKHASMSDYIGTVVTYFVACMFSMSALFLAPIVIFYTVLQCIIDRKKIIPASIILVMGFVVFYAINTPIDITNIQNDQPFYCFTRAWNDLYKSMLYVRNAFNFQSILGNNFGTITTASTIVSIIFAIFLLALIGFAYFKFKNRMNLLLLGTAFINMMFVFGNNMNPVSMYMSLVLMLLYAILNKEKRIYFSFVVFSILMFVNVSYYELFISYTATTPGMIPNNAMMYVFSSFELAFVLYYIYIVYDIVVTRKVRMIAAMPYAFPVWFKNLGVRIQRTYLKLRIKLQRK